MAMHTIKVSVHGPRKVADPTRRKAAPARAFTAEATFGAGRVTTATASSPLVAATRAVRELLAAMYRA